MPPSASSNRPIFRRSAPGERALLVAEQLALEQRVVQHGADSSATNGPLRRVSAAWIARATSSLPVPVSPWISTVEPIGPTCSIRSKIFRIFGLFETIVVEAVAVGTHLLAELLELVDQLAALEDPLDQEPELIRVVGLGDEVVGPGLHGVSAIGGVAVGGQHDHADREPLGADPGEQLEPAHVGHPQVGDHQVVLVGPQLVPRGAAVGDGLHLEPLGFEDLAEVMAIELAVVHGEDAAFHAA